ncbi:hypothetical protein [Sandarakinorhabdus sp.]|uniref:hypothetical protein n=1 Tax=Sandarakinorhabdus sp. TaxID=1916663 RepID=UPI00286DBC37|nr:hypothetical protein [Sandarakinorhabdus sp.]
MEMLRRFFVIAASFIALTACSGGIDTRVDEPSEKVFKRLYNMPAQSDAFAKAVQFPGTNYYVGKGGVSEVIWYFKQNGAGICHFVATVTPEGPSASRVKTSLVDDSKGTERYICKLVKVVGEESVAATLARRSADVAAVNKEIQKVMFNNLGAVADTVSREMMEMAPPADNDCKRGSFDDRITCQKFKKARENRNEGRNAGNLDQ